MIGERRPAEQLLEREREKRPRRKGEGGEEIDVCARERVRERARRTQREKNEINTNLYSLGFTLKKKSLYVSLFLSLDV